MAPEVTNDAGGRRAGAASVERPVARGVVHASDLDELVRDSVNEDVWTEHQFSGAREASDATTMREVLEARRALVDLCRHALRGVGVVW